MEVKSKGFHIVGAALLASLCGGASAQTPSPAHVTVFVGVNVIPMNWNDHVIPNTTVVVEGATIKAIGDGLSAPDGATVVDGHGTAFLSPGLADMHSHSDTRDDLIVYLANGVTTILNMGGARSGFIARDRVRVNRGEIPGPYVYAGFRIDGTPQYGEFIVTTPEEARSLVRLAKSNGYDFIKVYNNLSPACFYALIDEGRAQGIPVIGHGVTQVGLERQLAAGQLLVAHTEEFLYTFFAPPGSVHPDDPPSTPSPEQIPKAIALIKRQDAFVTADLATYDTIAKQSGKPAVVDEFMRMPEIRFLAPSWRIAWRAEDYKNRKGTLADKVAFLSMFTKAMADAGVPLVVGTDAPAIPGLLQGFSVHQDLKILQEAGLTPYQALSAATRIPGEFMEKAKPGSQPFGTVAPGNRADLILSAESPLNNLSTLRKPLGVMAHGTWYTAADLRVLLDGVAEKYSTAQP